MYSKYKEAESRLQKSVTPLGYSIQIEPITALDLYYSDGAAAHSYGKIVFKKSSLEFVVFFPDMYCYHGISAQVKDLIYAWLKEVT
jgi:hypothetical protein